MERFWIKRVEARRTLNSRVTRWEIRASRPANPFKTVFLSTINDLRASACQRALDGHRQIGLAIEPSPWGWTITGADLEPREASAS